MVNLKRYYVAVVSPCNFFQSGVRALFDTPSVTRAWHCQEVGEARWQLAAQPVDMLVMSLHIGQLTDLLPDLRFIQQVRISQPRVALVVILDVPMPYLVTRLCRLGVKHILGLGQSLVLWQAQLRHIQLAEDCLVDGALLESREEVLSLAERQVVKYLIQGMSLTEIATLTMRSIKTVSSHKGMALQKLGIRHYAQLIAVQSVFIDSTINGRGTDSSRLRSYCRM